MRTRACSQRLAVLRFHVGLGATLAGSALAGLVLSLVR
jgi:hypothetical protein